MFGKKMTESEWVGKVEEIKKQGEDWALRKQMLINLNYYVSNQWIGWDSAQRTVRVLPPDGQERITFNVIQPRVLTKLSKQTKNRIKYDVTPDTNDQNRIEVAKGGTKFVHAWWDEEEMDLKTRDIFLNNDVKGYCAAKVYFDSEAGKDITPDEGQVGYEKDMKSIHMGEVRCRICDPLTLYIDPAATTDDEIRWIVEEKPRDVDYVKVKYGKEVQPDDTVTYAPSFDITGATSLGVGDSTRKSKNMVMVRELWVKPCKEYPKGLKVTTTRMDFLDVDDKAGEFPYFIFGDIPIPGSVKYKAFIEAMLPIQRGLNIALTMFSTNMKKMGATKWTVPIGSGVDEEELNDEISGIIHYNATNGGKVERMPGADVPNGFDRIIEYYNRLIDDMSGAREISQGRLPAGLDTASGLQLMVEQENEKMAVTSQNYERGMKKLLKRVLLLMKRHYTEERLGRILGPDNEIELVSFTGSDLSGEEDINIVQGSSLPEMKSAQEDRIITLFKMGAIVNDDGMPDANTFLRMMGLGDSTELFEQKQLDENNAKMENKDFEDPNVMQAAIPYAQELQAYMATSQQLQAQGILNPLTKPQAPPGIPKVWSSDDHAVHIYNHNLFRKSSVYRKEMDDLMRLIVDQHIAEHEEALNAPMVQAQQQQMMMDQQQQEANMQEAEKQREFQMTSKAIEHENRMQEANLKGEIALQQSALKSNSG